MLKTFEEAVKNLARQARKKICLPEGDEVRTLQAANLLIDQNLVETCVIFLDNFALPNSVLKKNQKIIVIEPQRYATETSSYLEQKLRSKGKTPSEEELKRLGQSPLHQAGYLLDTGHVDAVVAGAVNTTADVIRAGLQTVGLAAGIKTVSGCFLMTVQAKDSQQRLMLWADCGVVVDPTPEQLADIAKSSVDTWQKVCSFEDSPKVGFLSFSTKGSARHREVEKVAEALTIFQRQCPRIDCDGELQFDAAYVSSIAQRKAPGSRVAGQVNIFIFPDLNSGNLGYKIAERVGGAKAYGPILQGLAKPFSDLSRGASPEDILMSACINLIR